MTYKEYKDQAQAEFNALPIFWAFSNDQFMEEMKKRSSALTIEEAAKLVYRFGNGGFYLKTDAQIIHDYMEKPDKLHELMKDPEFAEDAFYYEMANHEYHINWEADYDVCSCFGHAEYDDNASGVDYLTAMGYDKETIKAYYNARSRFLHDADENGWY